MSELFKPMLAVDADLDKLKFGLLASPKLDGIRAVVRNGVVYSRSNKPIPNKHVQNLFSSFEHFDGELIVGEPTDPLVYRNTTSGVMSVDGEPDVCLYVFDHIQNMKDSYRLRSRRLTKKHRVIVLEQEYIETLDDLLAYESNALSQGYEGLILRNLDAPYKMGRSTVREGYLLKLKRFSDAEALVVGFEERMRNDNEAFTDELGRTKRSSHKENKVGRGDLGALVCRTLEGNAVFSIGTGFTDEERKALWEASSSLVGRIVKYKFFDIGGYEVPRHPVFLGFRDKKDM